MTSLKLIYFMGCPNAEKAKAILQESGFEFDEIVQDQLPDKHPFQSYSSPSILLGDRLLVGTRLTGASASCSIFDLTKESLIQRIQAAKHLVKLAK